MGSNSDWWNVQYGSNARTVQWLSVRAQQGKSNLVQEALDAGVPAGGSNWLGETPLHLASSVQWPSQAVVVGLLLNSGAIPDPVEPAHGLTPLHVAARHSSSNVVSLLLAAGADKTLVDRNGLTAMDYVLQGLSDLSATAAMLSGTGA